MSMLNLLASVDLNKQYPSPWAGDRGIGDLVSLILGGSSSIAAVMIIVLLIGAGIGMIVASGQSDPESAEKAKKMATSAVIGALIIFFAFFIIRLIELVLGHPFVTEPGI